MWRRSWWQPQRPGRTKRCGPHTSIQQHEYIRLAHGASEIGGPRRPNRRILHQHPLNHFIHVSEPGTIGSGQVIKALALKTLEVVKQLRATFAPPTGGPTTAADLIDRVQVSPCHYQPIQTSMFKDLGCSCKVQGRIHVLEQDRALSYACTT